MNFKYDEKSGHTLTVTTDHGVNLEVFFEDQEVELVIVDENSEYLFIDDSALGVFVVIDKQFYSLYSVMIEASNQISEIVESINDDAWAIEASYLSCPYATDRI